MRIYNSKKNNNKVLSKYKNLQNYKKVIIKIFLILLSGTVLFAPIGLFRTNSKYSRLLGMTIYNFAGTFGPQYSYFVRDVFIFGDNLFGLSNRYLKSLINKKDGVEINLNSKNYQRILDLRNKAIKDSILVRSDKDKVNGYISYKGEKYPIKLRLKGDWTDHLLGDKWSFRVETKRGNAFLGMREFSLQHPRTRSYLSEFILHKFLRYENLPYLRYRFVPVSLNGKSLGIYALEEHFGKELIENSKLREGPILKISDQDKRNEWNRKFKAQEIDEYLNTTENNAEILTFNVDKVSRNKKKLSQFQLGMNLFNEFLKGNLKTSEIFDIKMTAKYFAVIDLLQALGANYWHDMRFYFDPITARFTPIGYDAQTPYILSKRYLSIDQNVLSLFKDPVFIREYAFQLHRVTDDEYLERFLKYISFDLNKEITTLNKSFPFITSNLVFEELFKNRIYIKNRLFRLDPIGISSFKINNEDELLELKIFNKTKFPIIIDKLEINNVDYLPFSNNYLYGENKRKRILTKKIVFKKEKNSKDNSKKNYKNIFKEKTFSENIILNFKLDGAFVSRKIKKKVFQDLEYSEISKPLINRNSTLKNFDKLIINKKEKEVLINGDITINRPLIIPQNFKLVISSGVNITLEKGGLILVQGPLVINGESLKIVKVKSLDGGKGISVFNANAKSLIKYAEFDNLKPNTESSTNITGAVSFYNSQVEIINTRFINSNSEDSLNLVRSPFILLRNSFVNNNFDAVDIDFSNGRIEDSLFEKSGNDAIDISGSEVILKNIQIKFAGDKAISIGEKSDVKINLLNIEDAFIGIASKDLSTVFIKGLNTNNSKICLASYQKKKEYGPGFIQLQDSYSECDSNYILEDGSSIISEGYNLMPNTDSAYKDLYEL